MQARPIGDEPGELSLDAPVAFVEAVRLMRYDYALHELSEDVADRTEPTRRPTALFVYRNPEHEVRYLELTPLARAIIERLLDGQALGAAITRRMRRGGHRPHGAVLAGQRQGIERSSRARGPLRREIRGGARRRMKHPSEIRLGLCFVPMWLEGARQNP